MRFATKIWHSNIDSKEGYIYLDALLEDWNPHKTIQTALTSLVDLLLKPMPFHLQDTNAAAMMFKKDFFQYRD